jgi:hypothetical protein
MKRFFTHPVFTIVAVLLFANSSAIAQSVLSTTTVSKSTVSKSDATVNIVLQSFELSKTSSTIKLNWQTATEKNNNYFEIQRSIDGIHYDVIALMFAKEDAEKGAAYRYTDQEPAKLNAAIVYYRLRIIDINGKSAVLDQKKIAFSEISLPK